MCRILLQVLMCTLIPAAGLAADPPTLAGSASSADEQTLKAAGIASDGPALLEFFRKRTLTDVERDKILALIRQLGNDSFKIREKASADLVALGTMAIPMLHPATKDPDLEVVRRAELCLQHIQAKDSGPAVPAAAARLLAVRKPAGTAKILLAFVPFADDDSVLEEIRGALAAVALRDGKPEPALVAALADKMPIRRAAAAEALCRAGVAGQRPALRKMLQDPEPAVRLRVALALAAAKEKEAIPVLIDLLAQLPPGQVWPAEDYLFSLAGEQAPSVALGSSTVSQRKCRDAWASWWRQHGDKVDLAKLATSPGRLGYTLVVVLDNLGAVSTGRVLELTADSKPRWQIEGLQFPLDAQWLPGERVLVAENSANRVTERTIKGQILWQKEIPGPIMAQRLANGHTFIASNDLVTEVDRDGKEVFAHHRPGNEMIMKALKLRNGDIAYVSSGHRFVRLSAAGKELQSFEVHVDVWGGRIDVLPNGHVMVPELSNNRVVEYDNQGKPVWTATINAPITAVRLPNGHTLITCMNQPVGVEVDQKGSVVWQYTANARINRLFRR